MVDGKFRWVKRPNFLHTDGKQGFFVAKARFYGVYYECIHAGLDALKPGLARPRLCGPIWFAGGKSVLGTPRLSVEVWSVAVNWLVGVRNSDQWLSFVCRKTVKFC